MRCKKCDQLLVLDEAITVAQYYKDMDYLVDDLGEIIEKTLQNYLIYKCIGCNSVEKFTYKDWELLQRRQIAKSVMEFRKTEVFKKINPQSLDPDNGIAYCGQCSGYGGDGYCLNDIIKQCILRK